ncbi:MAG: alpha/beta hydrolase [Actinomycetia bacterium]|nr:alpha/beta hydrolase [Actinomycetes bacterium]
MRVPSSDGVELAVFELGGSGSPILFSHATGFHGRCYQPMASELTDVARCVAFDYRGHGDTPRPPAEIDWQRYGDDATAMATWLAEQVGEPIVAFGHSMGGACLLMAAHREPSLFRRIVAFEPIVFPPFEHAESSEFESPMVASARRRRTSFQSLDEAIANFASKPPLNAFTPEALEAYVRHGFALEPDGSVRLKCSPDTEAGTFATGGLHDTWDRLPEIATDVLVISGRLQEMSPSMIAAQVAERLPNGRYLQRDDLDHFGPMTHPVECAAIVRAEFG